jgi:histidinol-phosphate phosphatase family protein
MTTESTRVVTRPTQAVILAGGRGTRMLPHTQTRPKTMIEFHGKPFLEYVIEMLRDQGFDRYVMLLGYLPEVIQSYFGDGRRWGIHIDYSVSDVDTLTSRRLQLAQHLIDPNFLLMYCDNYWPMQMDKMWSKFVAANVPAMITVYRNKDKFSRDSVIVGDDGLVKVFDRTRKTPGLSGVEISYAILTREVLELLPEQEMLIEEALYTQLAQDGRLAAFVTDHRYYSVGSTERLPITDLFFARQPTVILDRDGVLNKKPPKAEYVRSWSGFEWLPGAREALRLFRRGGVRVILVSNQAGIARGEMSEADLARIHEQMNVEVEEAGGHIERIYYCPHNWDSACECRKPRPGMLFQAQHDFHLDLSRTFFIGDDDRDGQTADAAGSPFLRVAQNRSLLDCTRELLGASTSSLALNRKIAAPTQRTEECRNTY